MIAPREGMVPPESVFRHHRSTVAFRALLLLHLKHRLQRAFAEIAGGGMNSPLGGLYRRMLRQGRGAPRRYGVRGLAGLFGRVGVVGRAFALDGPDAAPAFGLL